MNGVVMFHNELAEAADPQARWCSYQFTAGDPFQVCALSCFDRNVYALSSLDRTTYPFNIAVDVA